MTLIGVFNVHNEPFFVFPTKGHSAHTPRAVSQYTRVQVPRNRSFDGRLRALSGLCVIREFCTSHRPPQREVLPTEVAMSGIGFRYRPEVIERGPFGRRPRNPGIDVHFGSLEAPGLGIGAEGVELDFGVLVCGGNSGVQGDSGHGGPPR